MRLRARAHNTSSTLIGGKGEPSPSLLHTTLEGPTENISECKMDVKSTLIPTWLQNGSCFMVTWTFPQESPFGGRPNVKQGDHGTPNTHNR